MKAGSLSMHGFWKNITIPFLRRLNLQTIISAHTNTLGGGLNCTYCRQVYWPKVLLANEVNAIQSIPELEEKIQNLYVYGMFTLV